eukprot:TRINITY_DN5140_c0_g1_i1.p1 TRINITY_DN5140_c0_g1~~TRINITY_DN5140_c0_g1_i1.p1  ORF type:complete len:319 (+),score=54.25 TRINITY_DN5140_c0_g1_i1:49-957(+)
MSDAPVQPEAKTHTHSPNHHHHHHHHDHHHNHQHTHTPPHTHGHAHEHHHHHAAPQYPNHVIHGPQQSVHLSIGVSFEESLSGTSKYLIVEYEETCGVCAGTGVTVENHGCDMCSAEGVYVDPMSGRMAECHHCSGYGLFEVGRPCRHCDGHGLASSTVEQKVAVPPGVSSGDFKEYMLPRLGERAMFYMEHSDIPLATVPMQGTKEALALAVRFEVKEHPYYDREGHNIILKAPVAVSSSLAQRGGTVTVPNPRGGVLQVEVPAGCRDGARLSVEGKGFWDHYSDSVGDLHVRLVYSDRGY